MRRPASRRAAAVALVALAATACSDAGATPPALTASPAAPSAARPTGAPAGTPVPVATRTSPAAVPAPGPTATPDTPGPVEPPPVAPPASPPPAVPRPDLPTAEFLGLPTTLDEQGALAFGVYFVQLLDYTPRAMDPSLLEEMSTESCDNCLHMVDTVSNEAGRGRRVTDVRVWLRTVHLEHYDEDTRTAELLVEFSRTAGRLVERDGAVVEEYEPLTAELYLHLVWADEHWRVATWS